MLLFKSRGITRDKVDREIETGQKIEKIAAGTMQAVFARSKNELGEAYYKEAFNAFIFEPESVLKYFYGTNIPLPPPGSAECLVVITGAHNIDEEGFKAGERTAIVCGMVEKKDKDGNPELDKDKNPILRIVEPSFVLGEQAGSATSNAQVADQYPPRRTWTQLPLFGSLDFVVNQI